MIHFMESGAKLPASVIKLMSCSSYVKVTNCGALGVEIDIREGEASDEAITEAVSHLNERLGAKYKSDSKTTTKLLSGLLGQGYTAEDFKAVIDIKCDSWIGTDMAKFLRPQTLFSEKFESYLNEIGGLKSSKMAKANLIGELQSIFRGEK